MFYIKLLRKIFFSLSMICIVQVFAGGDKAAQKYQEDMQLAKYYMERTMYEDAKKLLVEMNKNSPDNKEIMIMLMQANMYSKQYKEVLAWSDKVMALQVDLPPFVFLIRGDAAVQVQQDSIAIEAYSKLVNMPTAPIAIKSKAEKAYTTILFQQQQKRNPKNIVLKNFSEIINTSMDEYYPVLTADGQSILFTRMDGRQEDVYLAQKDATSWMITPLEALNTPDNEGAATLTTDGKMIFYTACNRTDGMGSCDIFYALRQGNGQWMNAGGIGKPINTSSWESQPFYHTQLRTLFFSAIRDGGSGGRDIWYSTLDTNNKWSLPANMGSVINSAGDEETPYLHPDGVTLYFASNGHQGMGAKDIFMSRKQPDGSWGTPVNMGYPINTPKDESGFFVSTEGKNAYMASARDSGKGRLDIYSLELPESLRPQPATYLSIKVQDKETYKTLSSNFQIIDITDNKVILSGTTDHEGKIVTPLPAGKNYMLLIDKNAYLPYSENFAFAAPENYLPYEKNILLSPLREGNVFILKNVFFDVNSFVLDNKSNAELDKLVEYLKKNPALRLEVSGHTDNTGSAVSNQLLSENRAKSVVSYLVSKGIDAGRLQYKGYGDTKPIANNSSEEGKSQNRRTECKILK